MSRVAARIYFPFGENLTNETGGLSSSIKVLRHWPDAVSHIRLKRTKFVEKMTKFLYSKNYHKPS